MIKNIKDLAEFYFLQLRADLKHQGVNLDIGTFYASAQSAASNETVTIWQAFKSLKSLVVQEKLRLPVAIFNELIAAYERIQPTDDNYFGQLNLETVCTSEQFDLKAYLDSQLNFIMHNMRDPNLTIKRVNYYPERHNDLNCEITVLVNDEHEFNVSLNFEFGRFVGLASDDCQYHFEDTTMEAAALPYLDNIGMLTEAFLHLQQTDTAKLLVAATTGSLFVTTDGKETELLVEVCATDELLANMSIKGSLKEQQSDWLVGETQCVHYLTNEHGLVFACDVLNEEAALNLRNSLIQKRA